MRANMARTKLDEVLELINNNDLNPTKKRERKRLKQFMFRNNNKRASSFVLFSIYITFKEKNFQKELFKREKKREAKSSPTCFLLL